MDRGHHLGQPAWSLTKKATWRAIYNSHVVRFNFALDVKETVTHRTQVPAYYAVKGIPLGLSFHLRLSLGAL